MEALIRDLEKDLELMTKWLKESGLKVNEDKMELCVFHRMDCHPVFITLNQVKIKSVKSMNVLGVQFDSKLNWSCQVNNCIKKSKTALHAIRLIKGYFTKAELKQLITSNFYSILYYNSEIWHLPKLNPLLKIHLLAASATALKLCTPNYDTTISYLALHEINSRATPTKICHYKHALMLYKIFNDQQPPVDWIQLNFNQAMSSRQQYFECNDQSNFKVGKNILSNRLCAINRKILLKWLNLSFGNYKINCKKLFLE